MHQFKTILLFISILFTQSLMASTLGFDPCDEIDGHWSGTWMNSFNICSWQVEAQATTFGDIVRLEMKLIPHENSYCKPESYVFAGSCKDAGMIMYTRNITLTGTAFSNVISLGNTSYDLILRKVNEE